MAIFGSLLNHVFSFIAGKREASITVPGACRSVPDTTLLRLVIVVFNIRGASVLIRRRLSNTSQSHTA
jgi:hypothetical protein